MPVAASISQHAVTPVITSRSSQSQSPGLSCQPWLAISGQKESKGRPYQEQTVSNPPCLASAARAAPAARLDALHASIRVDPKTLHTHRGPAPLAPAVLLEVVGVAPKPSVRSSGPISSADRSEQNVVRKKVPMIRPSHEPFKYTMHSTSWWMKILPIPRLDP